MFRVQFAGESREQALANCCSCTQSLAQYVPVDLPGPVLLAGDSQDDDGLECRPPQQAVSSHGHAEGVFPRPAGDRDASSTLVMSCQP